MYTFAHFLQTVSIILQIKLGLTIQYNHSKSFNFSAELKSCERLQVPANGTLHGNDTAHGAKISFSCLKGFDIFGLRTLTCNNGQWSGSVPSCKGMRQFHTCTYLNYWLILGSLLIVMVEGDASSNHPHEVYFFYIRALHGTSLVVKPFAQWNITA